MAASQENHPEEETTDATDRADRNRSIREHPPPPFDPWFLLQFTLGQNVKLAGWQDARHDAQQRGWRNLARNAGLNRSALTVLRYL